MEISVLVTPAYISSTRDASASTPRILKRAPMVTRTICPDLVRPMRTLRALNGSLLARLRHPQGEELVGRLAGEEGDQSFNGRFVLEENAVKLLGDGHLDAVADGKLAGGGGRGDALGDLAVHHFAYFVERVAASQF